MTAALPAFAPQAGLWRWSVFSAVLAMAGLPIYIHAPKVYAETWGVPLAALGGVLALLRLIDVVQDPLLGWLALSRRTARGAWVGAALALMAASMLGLFAMAPPVAPLLWFALMLTGLFTAFSFLTICLYAEGVAQAATMGAGGHVRLAGWRETGALLGICLAAVAPTALAAVAVNPMAAFATGFATLAALAALAMLPVWGRAPVAADLPQAGILDALRPALTDGPARRLLLVALLNAAPVAVTSTLFLFFVESVLGAPGLEGPLLLLFFLGAAASSPVWARLAARHGARRVLLAGMALAIAAFLWATTLGAGDVWAFAAICALSGAALGADLTLLPALFATRLARLAPGAAPGAFGLWSFVSKLSLALAAAALLPALGAAGFTPGATGPAPAIALLSLLYAALPCALKMLAIVLLAFTPVDEV